MHLREFEAQAQNTIHRILNQLQTATLFVALLKTQIPLVEDSAKEELETLILVTGDSVKSLSLLLETFINQQQSL